MKKLYTKVIAAAKAGFEADGVELNPWLVGFSKICALFKGVSTKTTFFRKDLWKFNLEKYNNVVIFGVEQMVIHLNNSNLYFKLINLMMIILCFLDGKS